MRWQILYWNQGKVREALQRGEYDGASLTGWGRLDELMALAEGLGILQELHKIHSAKMRAPRRRTSSLKCCCIV